MKKTTKLRLSLPPTLNEYIKAERANKFKSANMKKEWTEQLAWEIKTQTRNKFTEPVEIMYYWYCQDKKKDKDNVAYGKKFINDALVMANVIPNDGWNNISSFRDYFEIDKNDPRVELSIREI